MFCGNIANLSRFCRFLRVGPYFDMDMQLTASADVDITMDIEVNFPSTTIDAYYPSSQSFPPVGSANPPEDPCECKYDVARVFFFMEDGPMQPLTYPSVRATWRMDQSSCTSFQRYSFSTSLVPTRLIPYTAEFRD